MSDFTDNMAKLQSFQDSDELAADIQRAGVFGRLLGLIIYLLLDLHVRLLFIEDPEED